jgi:hypothetical protein
MVDFNKYLQSNDTEHDAAVAFLKSLRKRGIHIDPRAVPKFVAFGIDGKHDPDTHRIVENVLAADFEHADELVAQLRDSGLHIDYSALVRNPVIYGKNVNHCRTMYDLREKSPGLSAMSPESQAEIYLAHLAEHGIKLSGERRLVRLFPKEYRSLLLDPDFVINVSLKTDNLLRRCNPGYSDLHLDRPRFVLGDNMLYDDFGRVLEQRAAKRGVIISDTICKECFPCYCRREMPDAPVPAYQN